MRSNIKELRFLLKSEIDKIEDPQLLKYLADLISLTAEENLSEDKRKALATIFSGIDVLAGNYEN